MECNWLRRLLLDPIHTIAYESWKCQAFQWFSSFFHSIRSQFILTQFANWPVKWPLVNIVLLPFALPLSMVTRFICSFPIHSTVPNRYQVSHSISSLFVERIKREAKRGKRAKNKCQSNRKRQHLALPTFHSLKWPLQNGVQIQSAIFNAQYSMQIFNDGRTT